MPGDCMGELISQLLSESFTFSCKIRGGMAQSYGDGSVLPENVTGTRSRAQARMPILLRGTIPQMHFRRLAAFLLGIWLGGSVFMDMVATQNFHSVDRLLAAPSPQVEERIQALGGRDAARAFL